MTTELSIRRWLRVAALVTAVLGIGASCQTGRSTLRGGLPAEQVQAYPPEVREAYQLFAVRCSRCHTLSRPLSASIYDIRHWEAYVARMRRHAGSGISRADAKQILVFLEHYSNENAVRDGIRPAATSTRGAQ